MQSDQRLTRPQDFASVRREGKSWSNRLLVLVARSNGGDVSRFGFSVGRRVGNAVVRNKIKRRLREAARLNGVQAGWDFVIIARRDASSADYHSLTRSMTALLGRAGVLKPSHQVLPASPKTT